MEDARKEAILAELVELVEARKLQEGEFTRMEFQEEASLTTGQAAYRLKGLVDEGVLERRKIQGGAWAYSKVKDYPNG